MKVDGDENLPYIPGTGFVEIVDGNKTTGEKGEATQGGITGVEFVEFVNDAAAGPKGLLDRQTIKQQIANTINSGVRAPISNGRGAAQRSATVIQNLFR